MIIDILLCLTSDDLLKKDIAGVGERVVLVSKSKKATASPSFNFVENNAVEEEPQKKNLAPHVIKKAHRDARKAKEADLKRRKEEEEAAERRRWREIEAANALQHELEVARMQAAELLRQEAALAAQRAEIERIAEYRRRQAMRQNARENERRAALEAMNAADQVYQAELSEVQKEFADAGFGEFYQNPVWGKQAHHVYDKQGNTDQLWQSRFIHEYLERVWLHLSPLVQWSHTLLTQLPPLLSLFTHITELNLSNNRLEDPFIESLWSTAADLRRVFLRHNCIQTLPGIGQAKALEVLDVSHNRLTHLEDISALTNLQTLELESNRLEFLPTGIECCTKLSHLNVRSNRIKIVSPALGMLLPSLTFLALRLNPIINIPPVVYLQGTRSSLKYLLDQVGLVIDEVAGTAREDFESLRTQPFLADVELRCNDAHDVTGALAHSCLLKARSPYLRARLEETNMIIDGRRVLTLDLSSTDLKVILDYIYLDKYDAPPIELLKAITNDMDWTQVETHNRIIKASYVAALAAMQRHATTFNLPYLHGLIQRIRSQYEAPLSSDASSSSTSTLQPTGTASATNSSSWIVDMKYLREDESTHDVFFSTTLSDGSTRCVGANKAILSARSPVFKAMLTGGMAEASMKEIPLPSFILALVEFVYMDDVDLEKEEAIVELLTASQEYQLPRLQSILESVIGFSLDVENAASLIRVAEDLQFEKLGKAAQFFILTHWDAVRSTPDWDTLPSSVVEKLTQKSKEWAAVAL